MKKTSPTLLVITALVATAFLQHRYAYADDPTPPTAAPAAADVTGPPTPTATVASPTRTAPRTFAYAGELQELLAKATAADGEVVTLSAGCALETHSDGSYTDISMPEHPKAYAADNTYIEVAAMTPEELAKAPMSAKRTAELLAAGGAGDAG